VAEARSATDEISAQVKGAGLDHPVVAKTADAICMRADQLLKAA